MSIEARQSSFVNEVLGLPGFYSAFETPLSIEEVVTIVAQFISFVPDGTILQALGLSSQYFGLPSISVSAFQQVSIQSYFQFSYEGGEQIEYPSGYGRLYCAYSFGENTYYTEFAPGRGCQVSQQLEVGVVAVVQITVSESIELSECVTAPQYIRIV